MPLRLLKTRSPTWELIEADEGRKPRYAILSHRWSADEVVYGDLTNLDNAKKKQGWQKVDKFRNIARRHGFDHVWTDTLCIDKSSSAELTEALNSMFRWYQNATICYAYLGDVLNAPDLTLPAEEDQTPLRLNPILEEPVDDVDGEAQLHSAGSVPRRNNTWSIRDSTRAASWPVNNPALVMNEGKEDKSQTNVQAAEQFNERSPLAERPPADIELHSFKDEWTPPAAWASFASSVWFTRGWTLQELIAPRDLVFFNSRWKEIGTVTSAQNIAEKMHTRKRDGQRNVAIKVFQVTGIPPELLLGERSIRTYSIAQKMSWAAKRQTFKIEDRAYSLLGIFDVSLSVIYGEGIRAFQRLQEELLRTTDDAAIFAWHDAEGESEVKQAIERRRLSNERMRREWEQEGRFRNSLGSNQEDASSDGTGTDDTESNGNEESGDTDEEEEDDDDDDEDDDEHGEGDSDDSSDKADYDYDLPEMIRYSNLLASSPDAFFKCGKMVPAFGRATSLALSTARVYQVVGQLVEFNAYVFDPLIKTYGWYNRRDKQVIIASYEDNFSLLVTLTVRSDHNRQWFAASASKRLRDVDIYFASTLSRSRTTAINVERMKPEKADEKFIHADDSELFSKERSEPSVILCRCRPTGGEQSRIRILTGKPATSWDRDQQAFIIPEGISKMYNAQLLLQIDGGAPIKLHIRDDELMTGSNFVASFLEMRHARYFKMLPGLWTLFGAMTYTQGQVLVARAEDRTLLYKRTTLIEIERLSRRAAVLPMLGLLIRASASITATVFTILPLPLAVVWSITAILVARKQTAFQYHESDAYTLDGSEVLALAIGVPVSLLVVGLVEVYDHTHGFSVTDEIGLGEEHAKRKLLIVLMNVASLVLCVLYYLSARRHTSDLEQHNLYDLGNSLGFLVEQSGITASIVRMGTSAVVILASAYTAYGELPGEELHLGSVLKLGFTLDIAVPLIKVGMTGPLIYDPRAQAACNGGSIDQNVAHFFSQYATAVGQTEFEVCLDFAFEGKLLWAIVGLALWEAFITVFSWTIAALRIASEWGDDTMWHQVYTHDDEAVDND